MPRQGEKGLTFVQNDFSQAERRRAGARGDALRPAAPELAVPHGPRPRLHHRSLRPRPAKRPQAHHPVRPVRTQPAVRARARRCAAKGAALSQRPGRAACLVFSAAIASNLNSGTRVGTTGTFHSKICPIRTFHRDYPYRWDSLGLRVSHRRVAPPVQATEQRRRRHAGHHHPAPARRPQGTLAHALSPL